MIWMVINLFILLLSNILNNILIINTSNYNYFKQMKKKIQPLNQKKSNQSIIKVIKLLQLNLIIYLIIIIILKYLIQKCIHNIMLNFNVYKEMILKVMVRKNFTHYKFYFILLFY